MDSAFIDRIQRISLTEEEGEVIKVRGTQRGKTLEECSLSLIGRFLTTQYYNQRAAKALLRSVWKLGSDLKIVDVGEGLFQFKFKMESQLTWVVHNGPWSFEGHILLLKRWELGMTARTVTFQSIPFWVQIWGLPFDLINEEAALDIGGGLGRVVEVDTKPFSSEQARFLRVRVEIPLDKPIRRGGFVSSPEGDKQRVGFKYERLEGLCFRCGFLGHEVKNCVKEKPSEQGEAPYGDWLKVGNKKPDNSGSRRGQGGGRYTSSPRGEAQPEGQQPTRDPPTCTPHVGINDAITDTPRNAHTQLETPDSPKTNEDRIPNRPINEPDIMGSVLPVKEKDENKDVTSMQGVVNLDSNTSLISVPINYVSNNYSQLNAMDTARGVDHETTIQKHGNS